MKRILPYLLLSLLSLQGIAFGGGNADIIGMEPVASPNWDANIYPNPNNGVFNVMIKGNSSRLNIVVFNIIGEKVFNLRVLGDHGAQIDLSGMEKGLYVVQIVDETRGEMVTKRMNIE